MACSPRASIGSTRRPSGSSRPRRSWAGSSPRRSSPRSGTARARSTPSPPARAPGVPLRAHDGRGGRVRLQARAHAGRRRGDAPRRRAAASSTAGRARRSSACYPERLAELAPRLAHHYREAEAWEPAAIHAHRAAEAARAVFANREALARYDQAITAASRGGAPGGDPAPASRGPRGRPRGPRGLRATPAPTTRPPSGWRSEPPSPLDEARILGTLAGLWGGHKDYERGLSLSREAVAVAERRGRHARTRGASPPKRACASGSWSSTWRA